MAFRFKQFAIDDSTCAMKVGTDGVLLGAWAFDSCTHNLPYRILDIGTGSGLIALMMAQRFPNAHIHAIDISESAVECAKHNFTYSPWNNRLTVEHIALQVLAQEQPCALFDIIISNPPYFVNSLHTPNADRTQARHTDTLTYEELICNASSLLSNNGLLAVILPREAEDEVITLANTHGLTIERITHVHTKPTKPAKRILIEAIKGSGKHKEVKVEQFLIEGKNTPRSEEYAALTKEFYL